MNDVAHRIAEMLLRTEAIQVYREKPFVFVSGRISPVYIDCRKILSFPEERDYIVTELARKVETAIGLANIDVVAGGETAGIPYASFVSYLIKKPMIYIRKQPKGYGGTKQIEGILEPGKRVLLVEDPYHRWPEQTPLQHRYSRSGSEDDPLPVCFRLCFGASPPT